MKWVKYNPQELLQQLEDSDEWQYNVLFCNRYSTIFYGMFSRVDPIDPLSFYDYTVDRYLDATFVPDFVCVVDSPNVEALEYRETFERMETRISELEEEIERRR